MSDEPKGDAYREGIKSGIAGWGYPNNYEPGTTLHAAFELGRREGESIAMVSDLNDD